MIGGVPEYALLGRVRRIEAGENANFSTYSLGIAAKQNKLVETRITLHLDTVSFSGC